MLTFDAILQNDPTLEDAIDYARGMVWCECSLKEQNIGYKRYEDTIDGIEVWYDYAGDYFFFSPEDPEEWEDNIEETENEY